jgi:hypothetical protein
MTSDHTPARPVTSSTPDLHCCETWHALARDGRVLENRPVQLQTWAAIECLQNELLRPLEEEFGLVQLTYGFASAELVKAVKQRAAAGGKRLGSGVGGGPAEQPREPIDDRPGRQVR